MRRNGLARIFALIAAFAVGPAVADAADTAPSGRSGMSELGDPYVPPAARHPSGEAPTSGEALRRQVDAKLQRRFEAADTQHTGQVTREQAQLAGWGYLVRHFDRIDTAHSGSVSLEQVRQYQSAAAARRRGR
ncbi:MAG TPA: hypothetical protein VFA75_06730 [Nevskia sp.]|nr:hypothetical protein [Nevskia sp.]